jgi:hypothetical protein
VARYVLQNGRTFEFLHSSPVTGDVAWTPSLHTALAFGVTADPEEVAQLVADHFTPGTALIVDVDADHG